MNITDVDTLLTLDDGDFSSMHVKERMKIRIDNIIRKLYKIASEIDVEQAE